MFLYIIRYMKVNSFSKLSTLTFQHVQEELANTIRAPINRFRHVHNQYTRNSFRVDSKQKPSPRLQLQGQPKGLEIALLKVFQRLHRKQQLHQLETFAASGRMCKPFYMTSTSSYAAQIYPTSTRHNKRRE